jgi:hypothetical protein
VSALRGRWDGSASRHNAALALARASEDDAEGAAEIALELYGLGL